VDRYVSPRIAFWTSSYAPEIEAIGSEVAVLRRHFRSSVAWGINPMCWVQCSWRRGFICHPNFWPMFRSSTWLLQRLFEVNHIFGSFHDWFYLTAASRRPLILTLVVRSTAVTLPNVERIDRIVVEWQSDSAALGGLGIAPESIKVIPPPVDLAQFSPATPPRYPFTVLFASSPDRIDWFSDRGLDALLDAAVLRPNYRFILIWRPWGSTHAEIKRWVADRKLTNVEIRHSAISQMQTVYQHAHATIAPFTSSTTTKSVPQSLVESLACGRPVVTTPLVSIGHDIEKAKAGVCVVANGAAIASGLDEVCDQWSEMSSNARAFAETHFPVSKFVNAYHALYSDLLM
jgi:glycosyltransferase involved in cell wall biosynthesis